MARGSITRRHLVAALLAGAAALAAPSGRGVEARASGPATIAAAADLQFALARIAANFQSETGEELRLVFGSSGNFARQIRQGAPFDMYLSADEDYVLDLARAGFTRDEGVLYAQGRIVLMVPPGSPIKADGTLETLRAALAEGRITRFAIANPDHAPYGRRAEEALRHAGLWEAIEPKLVFGENVSQAAQFATSANAQGGIVAYSLALAPAVAARGDFDLIPAEWHSPLRQRMALLREAGPVAERFYAYVRQPAARAVLRAFGFVLPGETD
jgi:molybdate transport system substrate-binding protein